MGMWTAIAIIVVAGVIGGIFSDKNKKRSNKETEAELKRLGAKVDALENDLRHRIETLERIVTNPGEDLKRQFEHLDKAS